MELLCPSGDFDSLKAAIYGGADAVYLGGTKYSARAYASNFNLESMTETIEYAHLYGVKVYITINTLLKNNEILDAYNYAVDIWNCGCDGIIIQDPGLIYLLNKYNPEIELHASTQMTVHNYEGASYGVKYLKLKRIVLSRELSLKEIKDISKDFETEIFIHGALCISYSGKCLMSSMLSGRSGNRGRCAQNCRMKYSLINDTETKAAGYLLSPKDISSMELIDQIKDTNTSSLKIEGRMKRKEYVYQSASDYRKRIDGFDVNDKKLLQLFNREGFSKAYFLSNDGKDMMAFNSPKNTGIQLGVVQNDFIVLKESISLGDGLGNRNKGFFVTKILDNKNNELSKGQIGQKVKIFPRNYANGDVLYKTNNSDLIKEINKRLEEKYPYKLNINIEGKFKIGSNIILRASYNDFTEEIVSDLVLEVANKAPLSKERIIENLKKSGDTPFFVENVDFDIFEEGFVALSKINELRRTLLENLQNSIKKIKREKSYTKMQEDIVSEANEKFNKSNKFDEISNLNKNNSDINKIHNTIISVCTMDQFNSSVNNMSHDIDVAIYPFYKNPKYLSIKDLKEIDRLGVKYILKLPVIIKEEFEIIINLIHSLKNIKAVITDNYAIFNIFLEGDSSLPIIADSKLNILNDYSKNSFTVVDKFTLSEELNSEELKNFTNKESYYYKLFGRDELMISEYCPIGSTIGCKTKNSKCNLACMRDTYRLKDEKGEIFPINTDIFCRSYILNGKVKDNLDKKNELESFGFNKFRIDLSDENYDETEKIINSFRKSENFKSEMSTRGHYKRGIE